MIWSQLCRRWPLQFLYFGLLLFSVAMLKYVFQRSDQVELQNKENNLRSSYNKTQFFTIMQFPSRDEINCSKIIKGDQQEVKRALLHQSNAKNKRLPANEMDYLKFTKDCNLYKKIRRFISIPLSKEEENFPIAYSMVIHEQIEMFERLLRAIYNPQNIYCVHVDEKSPESYKEAVRAIISCFENVFLASKLEKVVYTSWFRLKADLNCMEDLLKSNVPWRYLLNTCGTDLPIKTNAEIVRALKVLNGKNSLESKKPPKHKKVRWWFSYKTDTTIRRTFIMKGPPPISSPVFTGSAYFVVTREFVTYVLENPDVQKLIEWIKDTLIPEEQLWATINRMPGVPGSSPYHDKYELSDMNAIARLMKWDGLGGNIDKGAAYPSCTGIFRRSICINGAGDLHWMLQQHHLFANKFDPTVDDYAIQCLEEYLRHKALNEKEP
ncbi:beta-1,3-galactosyl-O-glycosyl-glycoprotein beta-1,6-N-acetylglucosaminyltransferase 3-like [Rhinatrema bivittatum]|uniref:beta-1,3-galactosyl-O-glycosyl-glycoprotein beta-1,6-N-acetylglucosaminyltransferase 3-like n=1 Tax=Rhinatrema bivittatum TaxID=194408 RepID=UPI001125DC81|nr:beta-1,3-galactosyl-O-glycosyl-glycoprotein beta-1,6-N-acetylglucosaminyltransferase 3-like [Rhinatrema bivittatum]XP_029446134.1 beta-1,3-galactosyl-O-glycosyl-glycoprotein beta-1,6-N-acetylglucosaminyltransferase 3-like [Rhinatrema bivittatum]